METLYTTEFDVLFKSKLPHLSNYPQLVPFIGKYWSQSANKILLLGESHFMPGDELDDIPDATYKQDWYKNSSDGFYEELADYINTRRVVNKADKLGEYKFEKSLSIFYNLKKTFQSNLESFRDESFIYPFVSYYNYFQRPAFVEGESIINNDVDNKIAYRTLCEIVNIIKPNQIIFVSKKAYNSFNAQKYIDINNSAFSELNISNVPHPSCSWWNRKSKVYNGMTGKEKFIELIKST